MMSRFFPLSRFWRTLLAILALCSCRSEGRAPAPDAGAPASAGFPMVMTDDLGHRVELATEPLRIVTLLPSHTETLFALGLGDRVIGVDDFSDFPPEAAALPRCGGLYDAHVEQIVALRPDLVLASEFGPAPDRLVALGLHVWAGSAAKLDDVFRVIAAVGHLAGRDAAAQALAARMHAEMEAVEAPLRGVPRVRVYYEIDATPYSVGPDSFVGAMLARAGGEDIVPRGLGDFPRISPELVIERDPEVILGVTREEAARRPGWAAISAVRTGRVDALTPAERDLATRSGPRIAQGLRIFAARLHPPSAP